MAKTRRSKKLQQTISLIQQRWGPTAIRVAQECEAASPPVLPTGFRAVDRLLAIGGLPQGRIAEFVASGTAGQATLAAKALVEAQRLGLHVAWVDIAHAVDLDFLARCGMAFDALTILRPWNFAHALAMTGDLLRGGGVGAVVVDTIADLLPDEQGALEAALREWNPLLSRAPCTLIALTETPSIGVYPAGLSVPFFAGVRLEFRRLDWLYSRGQVVGFTSRVTVLKNRHGPSGRWALIRVKYANGIQSGED